MDLDLTTPEGAESVASFHKTPRLPARFRVKSNRYGWWLTAKTTIPFILSISLIAEMPNQLLGWLFSMIIFGWSAYRIQFVLHDTCHMSLFDSRKLNDAVGTLSGLLVGIFFPRYRAIHFLHHKFNGLIEDPQLPDYLSDRKLKKKDFVIFLIEPLFGMRLIPYLKRDLLEAKVVRTKIPSPSTKWYCAVALIQLIIVVIITNGFSRPLFVISLYGGMATISLFLARLRTLAEHQQVGSTYSDFSRTHNRNWLDTLMLQDANFCYHLEHHLYPSVQSRHLPELLSELTDDLHTADSRGKSMFSTLFNAYRKL